MKPSSRESWDSRTRPRYLSVTQPHKRELSQGIYAWSVPRVCQQCHAEIADIASAAQCPACGGSLVARPGPDLDPPGVPPREADHRGILLPRRHPVGGVITPR